MSGCSSRLAPEAPTEPLLGLVGAAPCLLARLTRGRGRRPDSARADPATARGLGQLLELVGGLVDGLEMALMLVLTTGRSDVRVPALGHPPTRELYGALVEGRLEREQQQRLFQIEEARHAVKR